MSIASGDYVQIGRNALTWEVLTVGNGGATLKSGQSGRYRFERLERLRLFRKGTL